MEKLSQVENRLPHIKNLMLKKMKCRIFTRYPIGKIQGIILVITNPLHQVKWETYLQYETEEVINLFNNELSYRFLKKGSENMGKQSSKNKKIL